MKTKTLFLFLILIFWLTACGEQVTETTAIPQVVATDALSTPQIGERGELLVITHDSFSVSEWVAKEFETVNNARLTFLKSGDTGSALNRVILSRENPQADVFYGVDNTFLSRALEADIFEPYVSPMLELIPAQFQLDGLMRALPVDYGDVCINYDKAYFAEKDIALPQSLQSLTDPVYRGLLVVENPATSSPGLAFLLATVAEFGDPDFLEYWKALRANDVVVVNDWETAYYTNFSGSSGRGGQPLVVSYATSPVAEVVFAEQELKESPTGSIVAPNTCFRQIEFVGILKGTQKRSLAEKFVDFMLGLTFQQDLPLQMFVYPVNREASLPEAFVKHAQIPEQPAILSVEEIGQKREEWIKAWTEVVLK